MDRIGLDPRVDGLDWVSKNGPMSNSGGKMTCADTACDWLKTTKNVSRLF